MNGQNTACRVTSPPLNYSSVNCVQVACETISAEYCYADADTAWFIYTSGNNIPVTITFTAGQLLDNDNVMLYNGIDANAQLVFAGNLGGDVTGLALSSSNPDNALTLLITSDASGSCTTGEATPTLQWTVGCGLVGVEVHAVPHPLLYPDPANDELNVRWPVSFNADLVMDICDISGRSVMSERYHATGGSVRVIDVSGLAVGIYTVRSATPDLSRTERFRVAR